MANVKVPALLHKMSVSSQKAWYKKNNMPFPGQLTGAEGKSAAQAKKDVGEINKAKPAAQPEAKPSSQQVIQNLRKINAERTKRAMELGTAHRSGGVGTAGSSANASPLEKKLGSNTVQNLDQKKTASIGASPAERDMKKITDKETPQGVQRKPTRLTGRKLSIVGEETDTCAGGPMSLAQKLAKQAMSLKKKTSGADVPADKQIAQQMGENTIVEHDEDEHEYDHEGEMAKTQLKGMIMHAKKLHDMLEDDTNLPEWVQAKITLAADYMQTAADYVDSEQDEDLDEETQIDEKYMGFKALKASIAAKGGARDAGAVAAAIGRKKYGKAAFQKAAAKDEKMNEALDAVGHEDKDVNNDGKVDKTDGYILNRRAAVAKAIKDKMAKKLGK